jgi:8-oxo-dGTP pyrophosphatase MutT (NUDIX family)
MTDVIPAAGAVVWRPAADAVHGVEVLLVHRSKCDDWSLPEGNRESGEHILLTAVREVFEKTGVRSVLGPRLPTVEYQSGDFYKRVDYWSVLSPTHQATAGRDVDAVSWLPLPQAIQRLSYRPDTVVMAGLRPRQTVPLILLRHASAGRKANWPGDDQSRPLDAKGASDALALAGLLACFAPRARVLSSPALRCTETVRPYAASFGGTVEAEAALALSGRSGNSPSSRTDSGDSLADVVCGLVEAGSPAVICLHRENFSRAVAAACFALGAAPPPESPDRPLPKGSFLVIHMAAEELAEFERYEP